MRVRGRAHACMCDVGVCVCLHIRVRVHLVVWYIWRTHVAHIVRRRLHGVRMCTRVTDRYNVCVGLTWPQIPVLLKD
jgi:hypothetical protein